MQYALENIEISNNLEIRQKSKIANKGNFLKNE